MSAMRRILNRFQPDCYTCGKPILEKYLVSKGNSHGGVRYRHVSCARRVRLF